MTSLFAFLSVPLGWILRMIYDLIGNYGLSLVIFTILIRMVLLPTSISQQKGQAKQMRLQPKIRKIQQKYAGNQMKINEEMQALYSREGYSAMTAGCLPMLLQMPILFGLIGVIYQPLKYVLHLPAEVIKTLTDAVTAAGQSAQTAYTLELVVLNQKDTLLSTIGGLSPDVIEKIQNFNFNFLGFPLGAVPDTKQFNKLWIIPIASCLSGFLMSLYTFLRQRKTNPEMAKNPMMGCTMLLSPAMSLWFGFILPVGVGFYWTVSNLVAFAQMFLLNWTHAPKKVIARNMVDETIQKRSKEENQKMVAKRNLAGEEE